MRKLLPSLLALAAAASVQAAPITFTDIHDPSDKTLSVTGTSSYTFEHNILDNGFAPASHTITDVGLKLFLDDDGDLDWFLITLQPEYATATADGVLLGGAFEVDNGAYSFDVSASYLQTDGKLTVTVRATAGDFIFKKSQLDVVAGSTPAPAAVPEPGSMALMGLGVLGMGAAALRRKRKA